MLNLNPQGQRRHFTDDDLRKDIESGIKISEIAKKYGVTVQAIYSRQKNLNISTTAALVGPAESARFVKRQIDAMEELTRSLERVDLLMDACDEWLRDPENPERYTVEPRASEIHVVYYEYGTDGKRSKVKKPLDELLKIVDKVFETEAVESKHADPRELVLKTAQEVRQTVGAAADLAEKVLNARAMEAFRAALLAEISKVSPEVAANIAEAIRRSLLLHNALGGHETLQPDSSRVVGASDLNA